MKLGRRSDAIRRAIATARAWSASSASSSAGWRWNPRRRRASPTEDCCLSRAPGARPPLGPAPARDDCGSNGLSGDRPDRRCEIARSPDRPDHPMLSWTIIWSPSGSHTPSIAGARRRDARDAKRRTHRPAMLAARDPSGCLNTIGEQTERFNPQTAIGHRPSATGVSAGGRGVARGWGDRHRRRQAGPAVPTR